MRLEVRWALEEQEEVEDALATQRIAGLEPSDLAELRVLLPDAAEIRLEPSGIGKGASGLAVAVVVEIERAIGDTASLVGLGTAMWAAIRYVRKRRSLDPIVEDSTTLAALAAPSVQDRLAGLAYSGVIPIRAAPGLGTDSRDIWAVVFEDSARGSLLLVFMSPTGLCLGSAAVPFESYFEGSKVTHRTAEDIRTWHHG